MNLVMIGGNSANRLKEVIEKNLDNIEVTVFPSMGEFIELSNLRTLTVDRVILLYDGISFEDNLEQKLESFNNYICSWYPASRLITVMRDSSYSQLCANIFVSPLMVHMTAESMKPVMLLDIVQQPVELLRNKYKTTTFTSNADEVVEEVIDPNKVKKEKKPPQEKPKGKKKGIFGFLRRSKDKPSDGESTKMKLSPVGQELGKPAGTTENSEIEFDGSSQTSVISEEINIEDNEINVYDSEEDIQTQKNNSEEEDSDINFSIFKESPDSTEVGLGIGTGVNPNQTFSDEDLKWESDTSLDSIEEDLLGGNADFFDEEETDSGIEDDSSSEDMEEVESETFEIGKEKPEEREPSLDIHGDVQETPQDIVVEELVDLGSKVERLKNLQRSVFTKNIKTVEIPTRKLGATLPEELSEAETDAPLVEDLEELDREYESQNTKVLERVVEVEKVIKVESGRRAPKNGVRVIIVTGDRRSGITRTAINMAAHYAKESKTLFVDYDTFRRGSLLYFGLENVVQEEERVQDGLILLRNPNMLSNLVYYFPRGGFDCLLSSHGSEVTDETLLNAQRVLSVQREYKTVIIDCPMDNLRYLEDIILHSEIVICVDSSVPSVLNTVLALSSVSEDEKFMTSVYNNSSYFVSTDGSLSEFNTNKAYIEDLFSLETAVLNWCNISVVGNIKDFTKVLSMF